MEEGEAYYLQVFSEDLEEQKQATDLYQQLLEARELVLEEQDEEGEEEQEE